MGKFMKKRSRWLAFLLAAAVSIGTLSGCGGGGSSAEPAAAESSEAAAGESGSSEAADAGSANTGSAADSTGYVVPEEPVTIKFLHKGPEPEGWDAVYEKYLEMTRDTLNIELDITWVEHADYKEKLNLEITSGS